MRVLFFLFFIYSCCTLSLEARVCTVTPSEYTSGNGVYQKRGSLPPAGLHSQQHNAGYAEILRLLCCGSWVRMPLRASVFCVLWCCRYFRHWWCVNTTKRSYYYCEYSRWNNPITGLDRPWGFQEVEAQNFQANRRMKVVRLSALRSGHLYPPGKMPGTNFS